MAKGGLFEVCLVLALLPIVNPFFIINEKRGINGGFTCATCTVALGLVEQLAGIHNETVAMSLERLCTYMPLQYQVYCKLGIQYFGPIIIELFENNETPDVICHSLKLCYTEKGSDTCHLFPEPKHGLHKGIKRGQERMKRHLIQTFEKDLANILLRKFDICSLPGLKYLCDYLERIFDEHQPGEDLDGDGFSIISTLRGSSWRGKDCHDLVADYHPGARPVDSDRKRDSNCNGIYGVDPESGQPYEDKFCSETGSIGVVTLGDSVGAHFHAPPQWFTPSEITKDTFANLSFVIENEGDWPQLSASTGYKNISWPIISGPTRSVYHRLKLRNRCNHRDYNNLAVNGANSFDLQKYQKRFKRHIQRDQPALVILELVGNDVCNHYPDTLKHMTTTEDMQKNINGTLHYLASQLPKGSHLLMIGMADGRFLYKYLHERYHPIGQYKKDVTYPDLYKWFSCLQVTPCQGWLSTNSTLRDLTSQRSKELSQVMKDMAKQYNHTYPNFDIGYIDCPIGQLFVEWEKTHGPGTGWQLIEPVDGFHPNQMANAMFSDIVWDYLERNLPGFLGKENPHNEEILKIFKDQGGY
ncbi:acyloxyacyl hydrolase [Lingula anatina]|uniref:Acyloxyacyl hydrolase n=1 Tax=Lingula anatina TaxID=7574 RepID=A0A1S3JEB3_LINAN|nr:acyloxyacyl hydrolase [Lingula anatina]|eukprot:XP_013408747.1 acyloxyacyl hydrolase [Lingula anatina]